MSVQTGIYCFDNTEVSRLDVERQLWGLEERGPDYSGIFIRGSLGIGYGGFLITPEEQMNQPLVRDDGVLTFDGRLDDRLALCARLDDVSNSLDDATIVLRAYEQLGVNSFRLLMGEFAFVLWDRVQKFLFFVRSFCGSRHLYYIANRRRVIWSSEFDDLVIKSGIDPVVNDAYAIGFAHYQPDINESPFVNVLVVPPGSYVQLKREGETLSPVRTWNPELSPTLELTSDTSYEEACLQEIESAVSDRLRVKGPVFCELSGGLDSSTIALTADRVLDRSGRDLASLTTVSCTFETSREADENFFISLVEKHRGRRGLRIEEQSIKVGLGLEEIEFTGFPNTQHLFPGRYTTTERLMRAANARVLLSGNGGDELFWSDPFGSPELADLLFQGHFRSAFSLAMDWSRAAEVPFWQLFLTQAIAPLTARFSIIPWRPSDGLITSWTTNKSRAFLTEPGRRLGLQFDGQVRPPSRAVRILSLRSSTALLSAGYYHEYHGIYFSHPFAHQRLIEFMLSLPMNQITRPGEPRSLMRRATRGLLPEKTRIRRSKATLEEPLCRMLARNKHALFPTENLEVCRREYAEPKALAEAISQAALGNVERASGLLSLLGLERWLRSVPRIETRRSMLKRSCSYELKTGASAPLCPSEQSTHNSDRPARNGVEKGELYELRNSGN
jgi:asparagine synthase (glutamine-hydrolysing)